MSPAKGRKPIHSDGSSRHSSGDVFSPAESTPPRSVVACTFDDLLHAIQRNTRALTNHMDQQKTGHAQVIRSIDSCRDSILDLKKELDGYKSKSGELEGVCEMLTRETAALRQMVSDLGRDVSNMEQENKACTLEIRGVPAGASGEAAIEAVRRVGRALGLPGKDCGVLEARRAARGIVVRVANLSVKEEWLEGWRQWRRRGPEAAATSCGLSAGQGGLCVREALSRLNRRLYSGAVELRRAGQLQFVWSRGGTVLARKSAGSPAIPLLSLQDLHDI